MAPGSGGQRIPFFPKVDSAILSPKHQRERSPIHPRTVGPIYDSENANRPIEPWSTAVEMCLYPQTAEAYAPAPIPGKPTAFSSDRYLRAFLAENERLRLSMLWYYTRDILKEAEFLSGLQEKAFFAQESTGWEFVVIGILDVNFYIRLVTVGLQLAILPRGETICAHTITQPPGSVFLLPNLSEDWRFRESPYAELGGLQAYAGAPLRLQNESGDCVGLGSLCVASSTSQEPLTRPQQQTLVRLADWVVSDIVQCARARRQRERRRMSELVSMAQVEIEDAVSEEPVLRILKKTYSGAVISLQSSKAAHIEIEGRAPILTSDLVDGVWEDIEYLDDFIANSNHRDLPFTRVVRILAAPCERVSGLSLLVVASKHFQLVFDDVDSWFIQTCAAMLSQMWNKRLLAEVMRVKEKFLRGFSHQLRTPIHGILGSVELLSEELQLRNLRESAAYPGSELLEATQAAYFREPSIYLDTIKTAGLDLISIVNSMITLNRWADIAIADRSYAIHTVRELETELSNEILEVISGDRRYSASIFFNHNLPPDCDSLWIDLSLLRDSLFPLVMNAIQNTSEGAVIVTVSIRSDCKQLIIDVEDTGCGIRSDDQQRIFEPYEKVSMHSTGTGAGLGLTLASKFATLLHGSVVLMSSEIDRGSHFRATFREIECACSPLPPQPLTLKLKNIPSKFHHLASGLDGVLLCDYFARFLTSNGFTSSDNIKDSFAILDFLPDLKQRRTYMSQIPSEQVAICPIPASEGQVCREQVSSNVIYVNAPFSTLTMSLALEKADRLVSKIKASGLRLLQPDDRPLTLPKVDEWVVSITDLSDQVSPISGTTVPSMNRSEPGPFVESSVVIPILTAIPNSPKPTALLVDDNIVNLRILEMYCSKRGLPYCSATNGLEAVETFSKHQSLSAAGKADAIQLILMDLQMPLCNGIEATRQIRLLEKQNKWGEIILCIVTGQDSPTDRATADAAGADEYIVKPVGIKLLDSVVKRHFPAFGGG